MNKTKIFIVEDEVIVAKNIEKRLQNAGYEIAGIASSSEQAINCIEEKKPDLVLMDIKIKGSIDGIDTANLVRKKFNLPIIFLTSYTDEETFQRAKQTEPFGFLTKPFEIKELHRTIEMALYKNDINKKLVETQQRFEIAVQAGKTCVWELWLNENKFISEKNFKGLFGEISKPGFSFDDWLNLFSKEDKNIFLKLIDSCRSGLTTELFFEHKLLKPGGGEFWVTENAVVLQPEDSKPIRLIGATTDITKRKMAEEALANYTEQLKSLNLSKDKFFSIISHDLRSPFNALLGITDYLVQFHKDMNEEEVLDSIKNVHKSAQNLYSLILNLLEWSRLQTGRLEVEKSTINFSEILNEVFEIYTEISNSKQINLLSEIPGSVIIFADKYMISTVMRNLVSNAIKFTNPGGQILVKINLKNTFAEVSVEDSGIGISEENLEKIFRIDVQYRHAGTANEKGTGLGLILCKEFVEKNGGSIRVESNLNVGSKFIFTIPLTTNDIEKL
jgi:signal transduction histidine kinase/CheY-like chemotaxis protein